MLENILKELKTKASEDRKRGNKFFGIDIENSLGVPVPDIRSLAKKIGKNHLLALDLWKTGIHEARILATMVDEPDKVTEKQIESWVKDLNSWDICDHFCGNMVDKTKFAWKKPFEWSKRKEEYVKRAAFSLIAYLAVHQKKVPDKEFFKFFPLIKKESTDERNFVKKAVNWALREIGKRSLYLNKETIELAEEIGEKDSKSARWIASNALRELKSEQVRRRLK